MQLSNNSLRYGLVTKTFHWTMFALIVFLLLMGPLSHYFPRDSAEKFFVTWLHQSIGLTVFMLVILRFIWKFINPKPDYPIAMPNWQKRVSSVVHYLLYAAILLQPIAGMIMVRSKGRDINFFNIFSIPGFPEPNETLNEIAGFLHQEVFGKALLIFVIVHVLSALYNFFIVKDNILQKMGWGA